MTDSRWLAQVTRTELQAHTWTFSLLLPTGTTRCISESLCSQIVLQAHSHSLGQIVDGHTLGKNTKACTQKGSFHRAAFGMAGIPNSQVCTRTSMRHVKDCSNYRKKPLFPGWSGWSPELSRDLGPGLGRMGRGRVGVGGGDSAGWTKVRKTEQTRACTIPLSN